MSTASKIRLRFAKRGDLRFVSHHDLMRCLERLLRRAVLPMAHSQGFNPRPKVIFALPMGLGIEGRREVVELELAEPMEPAEVLARLAVVAPSGLEFHEGVAGPPGKSAPRVVRADYELEVPEAERPAAGLAIEALLASTSWPYLRRRPDRTVQIDLRPYLLAAALDVGGTLRFGLRVDPAGSARPEEIVEALGLRESLNRGAVLVRTDVELAPS